MRFLQVFRGYVRDTSCKTSKKAYVLFIVEHVIQLIIMSTMGETNCSRRLYMVILFKNNYACVLPIFERADIFISDAVYNNLKMIFSCFLWIQEHIGMIFYSQYCMPVGSEDSLMSLFKNR